MENVIFLDPDNNHYWGSESRAQVSLFFLKFGVDPTTGTSSRNDTGTLKAVMTPRPYVLRFEDGEGN
jgi:hypothetical protein